MIEFGVTQTRIAAGYNPARLVAGLLAMVHHQLFLYHASGEKDFGYKDLEALVAQLKANGDPQSLVDAYEIEPFLNPALFNELDIAGPGALAVGFDGRVILADIGALRRVLEKEETPENKATFEIERADVATRALTERLLKLSQSYLNLLKPDVTSKDFWKGVGIGLVWEGPKGTLIFVWDLATLNPLDVYNGASKLVSGYRWLYNTADEHSKNKPLVLAYKAALEHDAKEFINQLGKLDPETQQLLGVYAEVIQKELDKVGDYEKGKVFGVLLWAVIETILVEVGSAAIATPSVIRNFIARARSLNISEETIEKVVQGLERLARSERAAEAARVLKPFEGSPQNWWNSSNHANAKAM